MKQAHTFVVYKHFVIVSLHRQNIANYGVWNLLVMRTLYLIIILIILFLIFVYADGGGSNLQLRSKKSLN